MADPLEEAMERIDILRDAVMLQNERTTRVVRVCLEALQWTAVHSTDAEARERAAEAITDAAAVIKDLET